MWPGEQPPAGGQSPGNQPPNPYRQPGFQQPNPYAQQPPAPWNAPTVSAGPPTGGGGGGRTRVIAIVAAAAVVLASAVTGAVLLRGGDDKAAPGPTATSAPASPTASASADPRGGAGVQPTVAGWKAVVNPDLGVAFDVPPAWDVQSTSYAWWVSEESDPDEKLLVGMKAPAVLQENWCLSDEDRNGTEDNTALAIVGTRVNKGARSTEEIARTDSANWVYGDYAQPDHSKVTTGPATAFTTASGLTGSVATSQSSGVEKKDKCDSDGKSTTFAFKTPDGALASWSFAGAKGVKEEVPDATVRRVMATIRLYEAPTS